MTNPANPFQPAIDALEHDYADLERQANALLTTINVLREKAGLPPRPGGWTAQPHGTGVGGHAPAIKIHSDSFTGKKLGAAAREYLEMRKASGTDAPATSREIFDALKQGGFVSNAKDDATGMVVLRTMLRKNTATFVKLQNGKYGLRAWYPNLKAPKEAASVEPSGDEADEDKEAEGSPESETADSLDDADEPAVA